MIHASQLPRSCDRCYSLKERCEWTPHSAHCERCVRVGHACSTRRPIKRPGRPPAQRRNGHYQDTRGLGNVTTGNGVANADLQTALVLPGPKKSHLDDVLAAVGDLSQSEIASLDRAVHEDDFIQQFVLGPSFCETLKQKLAFHLVSSRPIVLDGYLACALSWGGKLEMNHSYRRAASALLTLRSIQVKDNLDITSCLILGWQILHFILKLGGGELLEICNQTLSLIKPHYIAENYFESAYFSFLTSLVLTETAECLLKTRIPTLRMDHPAASTHIDGCVGLCTSLLPHLYDLAEANFALQQRSQLGGDDAVDSDASESPNLDDLEGRIRDWKPHVPQDFCTKFTAMEVAHMMCQTATMQTAALLIIHRLRYPFGTEDAIAVAYASTIFSHLDMALLVTGKTPRSVDLPLIVASLEISDDLERARRLRQFSSIGTYSGVFHERIKGLIALVWSARRRSPNLYWYHLGDILSPFS